MMKNTIYLLALVLLACQNPKQNQTPSSYSNLDTLNNTDTSKLNEHISSVPSSLEEIKSAYATTMQKQENRTLDSITKPYNFNDERSGTVTYFLERGKLKIIRHAYAEYSHHEATDTYFIQDSILYFAYFKRLNWSFESGSAVDGATKEEVTENRIYFKENTPFRCLEKKYTLYSSTPNNSLAANTPNRMVNCKSAADLLVTFNKLVAFRTGAKF